MRAQFFKTLSKCVFDALDSELFKYLFPVRLLFAATLEAFCFGKKIVTRNSLSTSDQKVKKVDRINSFNTDKFCKCKKDIFQHVT